MEPFKDLGHRRLVARASMVFPLGLAGILLLGYGDSKGIAWMLPVGVLLFGIAFVGIGLCAFHGFVGFLAFGRPMPPRSDGTRGTSEEDERDRTDIRDRMRRMQRRAMAVLPIFAGGSSSASWVSHCRTRPCRC